MNKKEIKLTLAIDIGQHSQMIEGLSDESIVRMLSIRMDGVTFTIDDSTTESSTDSTFCVCTLCQKLMGKQ